MDKEGSIEKDENANCVFVGQKPTMSYVFAVQTQVEKGQKLIRIKARGRCISKAVDVAEIVLNKFLKHWKKGDITTGTEERVVKEENGTERTDRVSWEELIIQCKE